MNSDKLRYLETGNEYENMVTWEINSSCNFSCEYCFNKRSPSINNRPVLVKYAPEYICESFAKTQRKWRIHLTGGEPFMYPEFVKLCILLTGEHVISINTNLSTPNVYEFVDQVNPGRVFYINASLHIAERQKLHNGIKEFTEKVNCLQMRGFPVRVEYVAHPALFLRMQQDIDALRQSGVKVVNVKLFQGNYAGRRFPEGYNLAERQILDSVLLDQRENILLQGENSFFGKMCLAGNNFFRIKDNGDFTRCSTGAKVYGNLFSREYCFSEAILFCPFLVCRCPYEGIMFVQKKEPKKKFGSLLNQIIIETGCFLSNKVKRQLDA